VIKTIHLPGVYGDKMVDLDVDGVRSLIRGCVSQVPGFDKALRDHPNCYIVLANQDKSKMELVTHETVDWRFTDKLDQVYVLPEVQGGTGVEVVYAFVATYVGTGVVAAVITAVIYVAAIYAVSQLLAPSPLTGGTKEEENKSNLFDGVANITKPGGPVPIVYGIHTIGSTVLASDISTVDIPYVPPEPDEVNPDADPDAYDGSNDPPGGE
jgi:predicted phage tail protein